MAEKKVILVVDDDIVSLNATRAVLEPAYEISLAKSAAMAWNILNCTLIDLILLDVEMPMLSGLDFIGYLRNNAAFHHIPVIFLTSHGTQDILKKALYSGADGFVVKPVSHNVLQEKIKSVLENAKPVTERGFLLKNLHILDIACKTGKSKEAEKLAEVLSKIKYNVGTDKLLRTICKEVFQLNYSSAIEKIDELIKNKLFEVRKTTDD